MPKVFFVNEFREVEVRKGANLREVAVANGISVDREQLLGLNCKDRGICGVCKVWVKEKTRGATNPRGFKETHLFFRYFKGWRRLACQVQVLGDIEVWTVAGGRDRMAARTIEEPPTPSVGATPPPPEPEKPKAADKPVAAPPAVAETKPAATDTKAADDVASTTTTPATPGGSDEPSATT